MYRILLLAWTMLCFWGQLNAQKVLNSAGRTITLPGIIVEYSVGETATATLNLGNTIVTQGVLQPKLGIVSTNDAFDDRFGFKCYPNPTSDFLVVETNYMAFTQMQITDELGRMILDQVYNYAAIDCSQLPSGTYVISLYSNSKPETKTFKLIKQ